MHSVVGLRFRWCTQSSVYASDGALSRRFTLPAMHSVVGLRFRWCTQSSIDAFDHALSRRFTLSTMHFVFGSRFRPCTYRTNQQPPQRGGAVPDPVWVGSKWLLAFPRVSVTLNTPFLFFAMLPPERPQQGSTQHLQNRSPVFTFSSLLPYSCPSSSPHSSSSLDER